MFAPSLLAGLVAVQLVGGLLFPLELQQELLRAHNAVRAQTYAGNMTCGGGVMCPRAREPSAPLVWDAKLAGVASKHADRCTLGHSANSLYGENLYSKVGATRFSAALLTHAVRTKWGAEEARRWRFTTRLARTSAGHFTQLVWRNTARVGCGFAECSFGMFLVCNYDPKGNHLERAVYRPRVHPTARPTQPPSPTQPPTPRPTARRAPKTTANADTYDLREAVRTAQFWGYNVTYGTSCVTVRGLKQRFPRLSDPAVTQPHFVVMPLICTPSRTSYVNFGTMQLWIRGRTKLLKFGTQFKHFARCYSDTLAGCDGHWRFRTKGRGSYARDRWLVDRRISARWGCPQNPGEYNLPATTTAQNASDSPAASSASNGLDKNAQAGTQLAQADSSTTDLLPILLPVLGGVLLALVLTVAVCVCLRRRKQSAQLSADNAAMLPGDEFTAL